jgi:hypothetical protein
VRRGRNFVGDRSEDSAPVSTWRSAGIRSVRYCTGERCQQPIRPRFVVLC